MKLTRIPDNVKVHPIANRVIKQIEIFDRQLAAKIIQRIAALGFDPRPFNKECNSKIVQNFKKDKIFVRRLRCFDINDYRIFYAIKKSGLVCIYAVIFAGEGKHDDAYLEDSEHYMLIKLLYTKYWGECQ